MNTPLQVKAANIEANGHSLIPCQRNGNPNPYGNKQRYPASMVGKDDARFAVRLGDMILLDLDGNKVAEAPHPQDLLAILGLPIDMLPIQYRMLDDSQPDGSYHWLFRLPAGVKALPQHPVRPDSGFSQALDQPLKRLQQCPVL